MAVIASAFAAGTVRRTALAAVFGAGLIGCLSPAAAQTTVNYTEVIRSIFYLPSYIADKNGYFKEQGLDVKFHTAWGTDKTFPQLMSGSADLVLLGPESAVYVYNSPSPEKVKIFCGLTAKDGLLVMSRKKMSPAEFKWDRVKGKDYLDWRVGTTPQIDSLYVMKQHGIDPAKDLNYLTNVGSGARKAAWLGGKGDFGTFFEPVASLFEREGKGYVVASLGEEIGPFAYTVFMAKDKYIAKNPKVIQGWCNAIEKAQRFVAKAGPAELAKLSTSYFPQLDPALLTASIKRYQALDAWSTDVTVSKKAIEKVQDIQTVGGVLKPGQRVSYDKVVVRTFSENAKRQAK